MQTRFLCLVVAFLVTSGLCSAAVPESISYQGKLTTSRGVPVADGVHQVQFRLYADPEVESPFWTSEVMSVQTSGGVFSTQIGPVAGAILVDKKEVYLEVLAGDPLAPLTPRVKLLSVPYALQASGLQITGGAAAGKVLVSDASGNAVWKDPISYTAGSGLALSGNQFSISTAGAASGQALTFNGASVAWSNPKASDLTLPFWWSVDYSHNAFWVINAGLGTAGSFLINNDNNMNHALSATSNAAGGGAASFQITNAGNPYSVISGYTSGTGRVGDFRINNTSNSNPAVYAETNGSGPALKADGGTGLAGEFIGKTKTTDLQVTNGAGAGKVLTSDASGNATWQQVGTGTITATGASSGQALMYNGSSVAWGNPEAASLVLPYSDAVSSSSTALDITNSGLGTAGRFKLSSTSSGNASLVVEQNGVGDGMNINCSNSSNNASGIYIAKSGAGAAITPSALGTGTAISAYTRDGTLGSFLVDSTTNSNTALTLTHKGTGVGAKVAINNTSNNNAGIYAETNGTANAIQGEAVGNNSSAGYFNLSSSTSAKDTLVAFNSGSGSAIRARAWGTGAGIWAYTTGATGYGGKFENLNGSNPNTALYSNTTGTGRSAHFRIDNTSNNSAAMFAETNGTANAIEAKASGNGSAGYFHVDSSTSTKAGIYIYNGGSGPAIKALATNSGWAAEFYGDGANSNGVYITAPSNKVGLQVASGSKAAVVATSDGARLMYTEESAEVWFTDYGFGKLQQGRVTVTIDPKFAETVTLTEPYHVFVQLNDPESEGVAVTNKSAIGFDVIELRHGTSNAEFSYRIVARRKGYETERMKRSPSADNDPNLYPGK